RGHSVQCCDLSRQSLDDTVLREVELIAFYLPMHTATRLALQLLPSIRNKNRVAHFCAFGLYAPLNEAHLRHAGFSTVLGPEFESDLAQLAETLATGAAPPASKGNIGKLPRLAFEVPDRSGLPHFKKYAHVVLPDGQHRTAGYTEA